MVNNLWVIMPVYNEQECVKMVAKEWLPVLKKFNPSFTMLGINDGSKDQTLSILKSIELKEPNFKILDKPNSGHGQSCMTGYRYALENKAEWVFQIDSDGQCDPAYFEKLLAETITSKTIYGFRKSRDDGFRRFVISRFVSLFGFLATGIWVRDSNVPYRLMHKSTLQPILPLIPADFHLANIFLSILQQKMFGIKWVNIHFRNRMGGVASVKAYSFAKHGFKLFKQLRASYRKELN